MVNGNWSYCRLDKYLNLLTDYDANGSFADMAANVHTEWGHGYAWYVRATDLEQKLPLSEVRYADKSSYDFLKKSSLFGGELLMAKRGEIGKVYFFEMKTKYATLAPNLYLLKLNDKADGRFLYYYFLSKEGQKRIKAINASTSLGAIYKDDVKGLLVPSIRRKEQENIAVSLSDVDILITDLQKLIRKKKNIRQGTMQMLVTGKKRLDNFSGEWFDCTLDSIAYVLNGDRGINYPSGDDFIDFGIPFINAGNIIDNTIDVSSADYISIEKYNSLGGAKIQKNDIVFCLRGSLGKCAISDFTGGAPASSLCVIRAKDGIDARFLFHIINSEITSRQIDNLNAGSSQPNLSANSLKSFEYKIPKDADEQEMISKILTDMDSDIHKLEEKLSKYQKVKQGMMEELLTGKVRLV